MLFGVFYAYDVWEAVGNLVGLNIQAAALGVPLTGWGVALLVVALLVPFLAFGVALWLGRRRGPLVQVRAVPHGLRPGAGAHPRSLGALRARRLRLLLTRSPCDGGVVTERMRHAGSSRVAG